VREVATPFFGWHENCRFAADSPEDGAKVGGCRGFGHRSGGGGDWCVGGRDLDSERRPAEAGTPNASPQDGGAVIIRGNRPLSRRTPWCRR
jgi:hypothetical protein